MPQIEERLLLRRAEAASLLGISVDTLAHLIADRELQVVRIGRSVRIPRREVEALIERTLEAEPSSRGQDARAHEHRRKS
jgi:excisionase family DNA binding protein